MKRYLRSSIYAAVVLGALSQGAFARADTAQAGADNTATNKRDRQDSEPTADQQKNNRSDLDLTAKIRRSIIKDKSLSTYAHNVKIIAQDGVVTLKGPVRSEEEKSSVKQKAVAIAGDANVKCALEVKP